MKIFMTGAGGYIGGTVAARLIAGGHEVRGLVREESKGEVLRGLGIEPVVGSLDDASLLMREAELSDGVINTANADHEPSVVALLDGLAGSGKSFIHTSGSSVIGDDVRGNHLSDNVFDEDTPFVVAPLKQRRHALNQAILASAARGIRTVVICPTLIYGAGDGANKSSIQIPFLVQQAIESGVVRVVGTGVNRWSTVHIEDLARLYLLALESAPAGSFYFAENGESSFAEIGAAIASRLGLGSVQSWPADDAARAWGEAKAFFTFGSNSRVHARRARKDLGWTPTHDSATAWIRDEMAV